MAISVVTSSALPLGALTGPASVAADPLAESFSSLLSLQLSDLAGLLKAPMMETVASDDQTSIGEQSEAAATGEDPALLLAGMLAVAPPVLPPGTKAPTNDSALPSATDAAHGLLIAPDMAGQREAKTLVDDRSLIPASDLKPDAARSSISLAASASTTPAIVAGQNDVENAAAALLGAASAGKAKTQFGETLAAVSEESAAPEASSFVTPSGVTPPAHRAPAQHAPLAVPTPLHDTQWAHDFTDKVVWLARNEQQSAQININPPQLGPVQITLSLNGDQASAVFASPHAEVRQAIEDAMPRLRDMLSAAGLNLGQADVGAQFARQHFGNQSQTSDSPRTFSDNAILRNDSGPTTNESVTTMRSGRGLVDLFA